MQNQSDTPEPRSLLPKKLSSPAKQSRAFKVSYKDIQDEYHPNSEHNENTPRFSHQDVKKALSTRYDSYQKQAERKKMLKEFMELQKMNKVSEKQPNRMVYGRPEGFTNVGVTLETPSSHDSQMKMFVYPDYALKQFLIENQNIENLIPDRPAKVVDRKAKRQSLEREILVSRENKKIQAQVKKYEKAVETMKKQSLQVTPQKKPAVPSSKSSHMKSIQSRYQTSNSNSGVKKHKFLPRLKSSNLKFSKQTPSKCGYKKIEVTMEQDTMNESRKSFKNTINFTKLNEKLDQFESKKCSDKKDNKWKSLIHEHIKPEQPPQDVKKQRRNKALRKVKEYFEELLDANQGGSQACANSIESVKNVELNQSHEQEHTKRSSLSHHVSLKSTMRLERTISEEEAPVPQINVAAPEVVSENGDSCKNMPQSKGFNDPNTLGYELDIPKRKVSDRVKQDIFYSPRKRQSLEEQNQGPIRRVSGFDEPQRQVSGFQENKSNEEKPNLESKDSPQEQGITGFLQDDTSILVTGFEVDSQSSPEKNDKNQSALVVEKEEDKQLLNKKHLFIPDQQDDSGNGIPSQDATGYNDEPQVDEIVLFEANPVDKEKLSPPKPISNISQRSEFIDNSLSGGYSRFKIEQLSDGSTKTVIKASSSNNSSINARDEEIEDIIMNKSSQSKQGPTERNLGSLVYNQEVNGGKSPDATLDLSGLEMSQKIELQLKNGISVQSDGQHSQLYATKILDFSPGSILKINKEQGDAYVSNLIKDIQEKLQKEKMQSKQYIENLIDRIQSKLSVQKQNLVSVNSDSSLEAIVAVNIIQDSTNCPSYEIVEYEEDSQTLEIIQPEPDQNLINQAYFPIFDKPVPQNDPKIHRDQSQKDLMNSEVEQAYYQYNQEDDESLYQNSGQQYYIGNNHHYYQGQPNNLLQLEQILKNHIREYPDARLPYPLLFRIIWEAEEKILDQ